MIEPRFGIGDTVYMASYERVARSVICPDCLGSARVKVVLGDGSEILIECGGCDPGGYQGSTGHITQYDYAVSTKRHIVSGVNINFDDDDIEYRLDSTNGHSYIGYQNRDRWRVCATEAEAILDGEKQGAAHETEENRRLMSKTKNHKTWKWNMSYHRAQIKALEADLARHRSKVIICQANVKGEDNESGRAA